MTFLPPQDNLISGVGKADADIMIVGDCPSIQAVKEHRPIAAPAEGVLEACLHQAGLTKSEIFITNLIKDDTRVEKYWNERSKKVIANIDDFEMILDVEIGSTEPKVVVAMGELPAYVLTGNGSTTKTRGYPFLHKPTNNAPEVIVIPVLHPQKMIWGNYIWRYYLSHDLSKARELALDPELLYQPEIKTFIPKTFAEAVSMLAEISKYDKVSVDIEIDNFEVSCIGFSVRPDCAFSIPTDMRWTLEEEVTLWNCIAAILGNSDITKIGQNFIFDIHFLAYKMNIITRGPIIDTMMAHSILYPDFLKSLNFLGSVYTKQPYWKDMVKFKDIKAES
ncbi:hypothetical protein LCGC14_3009300 [marine sediment metagenome]|uniref:Uracil-DNA glycosylase-like domain-containing protein n=1 Tax=marine sediment metagenome TaxID=412755 RepID=A0A0F8WYM3_9ZZZZ